MIYVLLFVAMTSDGLDYYQIGGTYPNKVDCDKERIKASALLRNGTGLYCIEVDRN
jgi:hypothetical protein